MKGYERYSKLKKNKNLKSKFIVNYKIDRENSNLIVTYLNKNTEIIPFSKNKINEFNSTMEKQYNEYHIEAIENRYLVLDSRVLAVGALLGINFTTQESDSLYKFFIALITSGLSIYQIYQIIRCRLTINEHAKQYYYMENKEYFVDPLLSDYKLNKFLSERELSVLKKSFNETDSYFNLSSIDNYDLKTLRKIKHTIDENNPKYKVKTQHKKCR